MEKELEPTIVNLQLNDDILYHQRHGIFKNRLDKPYHNFAYFSKTFPIINQKK